ncbi:MAG: mechanosensitive ion channel family protein [Gammaproteobacteria bacterium]|nr:mechanosensitive ion channel family protein [Gammaproteobacteria bacterium]
MNELLGNLDGLSLPLRLIGTAVLAVVTHLIVVLIRHLATFAHVGQQTKRFQKLRSVVTLATSAVIFSLYFFAIGLILKEFGVSLTAYLASASVIGLAIGFGSQGIVQDVVTGLTLIFSDLVDVGDLVEIGGQTGIVRAITMRFTELENALGANVFIPNRTINNIISYPRGYVRCIVDVTLRGSEEARKITEISALRIMQSTREQFPGILIAAPSSEGRIKLKAGKEILRIKFRIWPARGQPIETNYLQELIAELKQNDPDYQPWMIAVSYEVEEKTQRPQQAWPWQLSKRQAADAPGRQI